MAASQAHQFGSWQLQIQITSTCCVEYVLALFMLPGYPVAHLNFRGCSLMTSKMDLVEIHAPSETDENL